MSVQRFDILGFEEFGDPVVGQIERTRLLALHQRQIDTFADGRDMNHWLGTHKLYVSLSRLTVRLESLTYLAHTSSSVMAYNAQHVEAFVINSSLLDILAMPSLESYSSQVAGWLVINTQRLPLAQVGPTSCVLRDEASLSPGVAMVIVEVDGQISERQVLLQEAVASSSQVRFVAT